MLASTPDRKPWRDGAGLVGPAPDHTPLDPDDAPALGIDLGDLAAAPAPLTHPIPFIRSQRRPGGDLDALNRVIAAMPTYDTQILILRIGTADDPLKLWALHLELNARGIAPALRWPSNTSTPQTEFITIMADLLWLGTTYPDHAPAFKGWQQLFKLTPDSDDWHTKAFWILSNTKGAHLSKQFTKGLALTLGQDHRQELMWIQTAPMYHTRFKLKAKFEQIWQHLLDHAIAHPDNNKAGKHRPGDIASRNARLHRTHVLAGGNSPETTRKNWQLLTGEALSRQAVSKRLAAIKKILETLG